MEKFQTGDINKVNNIYLAKNKNQTVTAVAAQHAKAVRKRDTVPISGEPGQTAAGKRSPRKAVNSSIVKAQEDKSKKSAVKSKKNDQILYLKKKYGQRAVLDFTKGNNATVVVTTRTRVSHGKDGRRTEMVGMVTNSISSKREKVLTAKDKMQSSLLRKSDYLHIFVETFACSIPKAALYLAKLLSCNILKDSGKVDLTLFKQK